MKKIIYGLTLCLSALTFLSCEINDPNADKFGNDPQSGWVQFTNTEATDFPTSCGSAVEIPLTLSAPSNEDGLDVYYTITDVSGSTANLETYATIPAGSREGSIVISNPEVLTSPVEFVVTLTSTSRPNVGIGFPDTGEQTMTVRLLPGAAGFSGSYDVDENSDEGFFEYTSNVTFGAAPNELIISNIYGVDPDAQTTVFVNPDGTLSFPDFMDNLLYTTSGGTNVYLEGIDGTVADNPCSGGIEINFNLRSGANGANVTGPYNVILTRQ